MRARVGAEEIVKDKLTTTLSSSELDMGLFDRLHQRWLDCEVQLRWLIIFRVCNALLVQTHFNPDEYWQSLEVSTALFDPSQQQLTPAPRWNRWPTTWSGDTGHSPGNGLE